MNNRGVVLIIFSLLFPALAAMIGLMVDTGIAMSERNSAQGAADNAARSAAVIAWLDSASNGVPASTQIVDVTNEARAVAAANGFVHGSSRSLGANVTVTVNVPPVASSKYSGTADMVEVIIEQDYNNFFGTWFNLPKSKLRARAVATWPFAPCIVALNGSSNSPGISVSGGAQLDVPCGVYSNSLKSPGSVIANGANTYLNAAIIASQGASDPLSNNFLNSIITNDAPQIINPYLGAGWPQTAVSLSNNKNPSVNSFTLQRILTDGTTYETVKIEDCSVTGVNCMRNSADLAKVSTSTCSGAYCTTLNSKNTVTTYTARTINCANDCTAALSNMTVAQRSIGVVIQNCCFNGTTTFPTGTYYFADDIATTGSIDARGDTNGSSPTPSGVTFVLPPGGRVNVSGQGGLNILPQSNIGDWRDGISIYASPLASHPNGTIGCGISGGGQSGLNGAIILPDCDLSVSGNVTSGQSLNALSSLTNACLSFISWTTNITGGGSIGKGCPAKSINTSTIRSGYLVE